MTAPVVDARGDLLRYGRTLAVAYPDLTRAVHAVVAELDRLARVETAAAVLVADAALFDDADLVVSEDLVGKLRAALVARAPA